MIVYVREEIVGMGREDGARVTEGERGKNCVCMGRGQCV